MSSCVDKLPTTIEARLKKLAKESNCERKYFQVLDYLALVGQYFTAGEIGELELAGRAEFLTKRVGDLLESYHAFASDRLYRQEAREAFDLELRNNLEFLMQATADSHFWPLTYQEHYRVDRQLPVSEKVSQAAENVCRDQGYLALKFLLNFPPPSHNDNQSDLIWTRTYLWKKTLGYWANIRDKNLAYDFSSALVDLLTSHQAVDEHRKIALELFRMEARRSSAVVLAATIELMEPHYRLREIVHRLGEALVRLDHSPLIYLAQMITANQRATADDWAKMVEVAARLADKGDNK